MLRKKVIFLLGIIIISVFLFPQPVKADTEIVPIYTEEDVSISAMWDEDGIFLSYHNYWEYNLYLGGSLYSGGELRTKSITFLKFNIPNRTLGENEFITSMKVRLTQTALRNYAWLIKTELVENNWVSENMTWDNQPESIGSSIIYSNFTFSSAGSNHYIELINFIDDIENGTMSIKIECFYNEDDDALFYSEERGEDFEKPVLIMKYEDMSPPTPFILTSNAGNPDDDGEFILEWTDSEHMNNYSLYQNDYLIGSGVMNQYLIEISINGTYNFKVIASNEYGSNSSNEITVIVGIPPPPPPPTPYPLVLSSDAANPDIDGIFTLYWTESTHANSYSVYQNDILMDNGLTTLYYDIGIDTDGSYNFKIIAFNDYGNISSNEITVNIKIPLPPPNPFTLTSDADTPDTDGNIMLYWSSSAYTDVYSVYSDDVLLAWGITNLYYNVKIYADGSYNFKVVALNDYGQTTSNEITVNVEIPIVQPEPPEPIERDIIPFIVGFSVGIGVLGVIVVVGVVYRIKKVRNFTS